MGVSAKIGTSLPAPMSSATAQSGIITMPAPAQLFNNIYLRGGANGLADFWAKEQEKGVTHLALNLKPTQRPADEVLTELAECVLSRF